jgi:hypothetical protein
VIKREEGRTCDLFCVAGISRSGTEIYDDRFYTFDIGE